jgi:Uracil DNA glycosylase superfamily
MIHAFDPGPVAEPFASLAREYPGAEVYPAEDFRVEWGPVFHRGRLDGSARILVLGQDPGQHESIGHRILIGEAGQRVQGFLRKLGIERSYTMLNAYLYSVYGQQAGERHADDEAIIAYRHRWLDALLVDSGVEAVISFGHLGRDAFEGWRNTAAGQQVQVGFEHLTHPTMPEASSRGDQAKKAAAMKKMLGEWNAALQRLDATLGQRDVPRDLVLYGEDLLPEDRAPIPEADLPAGTPPWMRSVEQWAQRKAVGDNLTPEQQTEAKRATVVVTVPQGERPWH